MDAAAVCKAVTLSSMRFVAVEDQQSALMLHEARELLIRQRTMLVNALRAHMALVVPGTCCLIDIRPVDLEIHDHGTARARRRYSVDR